jgi:hypothetical protein
MALMPDGVVYFNVSLTETRHFRRLVAFVMDCESLASINADDELQALVDEVRDDLANGGNP